MAAVELTVCRLCARSRPDIWKTLARLRAAHPHELCIVELDCMAACDDVPAIMIDYDYVPRITPQQLIELVEARLNGKEEIGKMSER
ncbi:NAD(P)H-dependent oxidoreductase subunit E [Chloroflexus sp. MS-CIW-1]|uniref:NAD(P)H-dependent oxidoreductase subunit E n=1 Tax=unclassified Chloroflexus TaxID=2633855 RepID=UPI00068F4251|nr:MULTISPECIES: NAD(P)H-dependent oxidoreductase subunit E [unclassified Chloroflexus]MDN5273618.1 NAD(P)H-dependent oxidoreductase subunit E [Chloroflexus sp. MS-CIW-1]